MKKMTKIIFVLLAAMLCFEGLNNSASADVFTDANQDNEILYFAYAGEQDIPSQATESHKLEATIDLNSLDNYFDDVLQDQEQGKRHQQFVNTLAR